MIRGPERTPYEDGLFFFDFQLSADYPRAPPLCHYVTYCSDKLNPNLYEDGKVSSGDEQMAGVFKGMLLCLLFRITQYRIFLGGEISVIIIHAEPKPL